jgi:2-polyprenyl-6-methoxyphenol hydroxylase-like FAD-dependent oxidoreductase
MRVLVVGGGIGGLSAALALRYAGAKVRVYEQAAELGEVGAGVGLFPNSIRIMQRLGVADSVTRRGAPIKEWWMLAPGGAVLSHQVAGRDGPVSSPGMYRPDMVAELAAGLPRGALHPGHRCVAFTQDDRYGQARCSTSSDLCQPMSRCVNYGQRLVIRQYWPPNSPTGIRSYLGYSRMSIRRSGGVCTTEIRYRAGRMVG